MNALVLCEAVITDKRSGNSSLINCFNALGSSSFPFNASNFCVFASVTNVLKGTTVRVEVKHLSDEEPLVLICSQIHDSQPHDVHEMVCDISGIEFRKPGVYQVTLISEERLVGSRQFIVAEIKEENQ